MSACFAISSCSRMRMKVIIATGTYSHLARCLCLSLERQTFSTFCVFFLHRKPVASIQYDRKVWNLRRVLNCLLVHTGSLPNDA